MTAPSTWRSAGPARWLNKCDGTLDWSAVCARKLRLDPYLVWADLTSEPVDASQTEVTIGLLMQFSSREAAQQAARQFAKPGDGAHAQVRSVASMLYGYANPSMIANAISFVGQGALRSFELSLAREVDSLSKTSPFASSVRLAGFPGAQLAVSNTNPASLQLLASNLFESAAPNSTPIPLNSGRVENPPPLLCAIDDRCNFASASLGTRVVSLWNQSSDKSTRDRVYADGSVWETRLGIGGRVLKLPPADPNASEIDRYRTARYLYPTPQWSHGSAVLDLLAGHDLRLARAGPGTTPREIGRQRWPGGAPPKVHFVQLPVSTILDTSGGALSTHVLDGIQYAIDQAEPNQSVIVNCSYGTHGGPHDGSSMFERALYELLVFYDGPASRKDNLGKTLHVVLPAGNSHLLRCHASEWLGPGREMKLPWKVLPDDPTDNFVEIWIGDDDDVSITVEPPGGERSPAMLRGEAWTWDLGNDGVRACLVFPWNAAQGEKGAMALLAVAATREGGYAYGPENAASGSTQLKNAQTLQGRYLKLAPHGVWNITICNRKKSDGTPQQCASVHAWVQRGDFAPGRGRETRGYWGRQSYFVDDGSGLVNPRFTLNGIATAQHPRLFVVGAMRHHDHCVSRYSAAGPNRESGERCEGPDLVTVADESIHLPGLLLRGTTAGSRVRVSGTSVAAPLVARLLYEHLLAGKTAESFVHSYALDECTHVEPLGEGQPEWAEPFLRGATHRLVPTDDDGALIRRAKAPYAAAGNANEVGSQSPCLARAP